jgi:hypothetical protein
MTTSPHRASQATLAALALAALLAGRPLQGQGQVLRTTEQSTFSLRDQSIWGPGAATVIEKSYSISRAFIGTGGFNAILGKARDPAFFNQDTRLGVALGAFASGSIGFEAAARVNSGSLDGDATITRRLDVYRPSATPQVGDVMTLKSGTQDRAVTFSSEGPSVEARAAVSGRLLASMSGTGCILFAGCSTSTSTLVNLPSFTQEIASYNWNESGKLKILGQDLPGFNFGEAIDVPGVAGASFTLYTPDLDVDHAAGSNVARGTARTDLARLDIDPLQLGLSVALPGSECVLACSLSLGPLSVDYTLFSATLGAVVGLRQELELSLARPFTRFDFSTPTRVREGSGWSAPLTYKEVEGWNAGLEVEYTTGPFGMPLAVTPTYGIVGSLRNTTFLTLDPSFTVTALEGSVPGYDFGPVYEHEWRFGGLSVPVLSTKFDVPFGTFTGQSIFLGTPIALGTPAPGEPPLPPPYDPWSAAISTPEPGTFALAAGGLLLVAAVARRRPPARGLTGRDVA